MMTLKKIFVAIGLMMLLQNAWAIDIRSAKAEGLIGEANTGYIAAVQTPASAEVRALIADVNQKRKTRSKAQPKRRARRWHRLPIASTNWPCRKPRREIIIRTLTVAGRRNRLTPYQSLGTTYSCSRNFA